MSNTTRRVVTATLALLFGFGAAWIAFRASDSVTGDPAGTVLGVLDVAKYCRAEHGEDAEGVRTRLDAYGWNCAFTLAGRYRVEVIDLDSACTTMYEKTSFARSRDTSDPYGWECVSGKKSDG